MALAKAISRTSCFGSRTLVCRHFTSLSSTNKKQLQNLSKLSSTNFQIRYFNEDEGVAAKKAQGNFKNRVSGTGLGGWWNTRMGEQTSEGVVVGVGFVLAVGICVGYTQYSLHKEDQKLHKKGIGHENTYKDYLVEEDIPEHKFARSLRNPADNTKIKFTLYQFQSCPFCCKARAFLDYYGLNYDVVEVNSVTRKQMKWSKKYKKVPMVVAELEDGSKFQLVDSTALISALYSFLFDKPKGGLAEVLGCYPHVLNEDDPKKFDIMNRYFLMYQHSTPDKEKTEILKERQWRKWVDDTLVHTLSPNVYRTPSEALQAFNWFDKWGNWDEHFATWERYLVIYLGAFVMWIIGKNLKKRHRLKTDVRESLYDDVNHWLRQMEKKKTPFMGGQQADLSDLAVYGVLSAIEGCDAFQDLLENTKVGPWFQRMKEACAQHKGQAIFH